MADHRRDAEAAAEADKPAEKMASEEAKADVPLAVKDPALFVAERRKAIDDEASALNRRTKGWIYVLPAYKYANMDKRLEDLLKPRA